MRLKAHFVATLAVCALAVPAMTTTFLALAPTAALAKSNGKGNGGGGARGNSGAHKPATPRGNGKPATSRGNSGSHKPAAAPPATPITEASLAPNQLGSMNGAMHANINAVLAHIRNGNVNGPVGALAALAVADYNATEAQAVLDRAAQYAPLDTALSNAGYDSLDAYREAVAAGTSAPDPIVEAAILALGDAADQPPPSADDITAANEALMAQSDAESGVYDAWNKSGDATDDQKAELLASLRSRLDAESDSIADTMAALQESYAPATDDTEDVTEVIDSIKY